MSVWRACAAGSEDKKADKACLGTDLLLFHIPILQNLIFFPVGFPVINTPGIDIMTGRD